MVTISRQAGAGGEEIAGLLARQLGWKTLDNELVETLLAARGIPEPETRSYTERQPGLWQRLSSERHRYLEYLKLVSYEFAREGDCIILGRGGQILFADVPGVVRVRVVAPLADRVARAKAGAGGEEAHFRQALQHEDNERAGFHRFLFRVNWDCPELYDLIIDTHRLSAQAAADVILKALGNQEVKHRRPEARRKLDELYRVQQALVSILFEERLAIHGLEVVTADGTVMLRGTAEARSAIERATDVAQTVFGTHRVVNQIAFEPRFAGIMAGSSLER